MDDLTHIVEIRIIGNYPDGLKNHVVIAVSGDGGREHVEQAFTTVLASLGFANSDKKPHSHVR